MAHPNANKPIYQCNVKLALTARHPMIDQETGEVTYKVGKVRLGDQFVWQGDPNVCPPHFSVVKPAKQKPGPKPKAKEPMARADDAEPKAEAAAAQSE